MAESEAPTPEAPGSESVSGKAESDRAERLSPGQPESTDIESLRSISETVRVDIRKLDELMNLVGELVIQRNAIASVANRLASDVQTVRIGAELTKTHKMLDRKLKELQAGVLDVRMVPLRQIFEKLSRVVRRLRRELDKDVELEFKGADTELDKLIVEQLVDPLVHLVRNSTDHALEPADEPGKRDRVIVYVGMRRGGLNYYALEITPHKVEHASSGLTSQTALGDVFPRFLWRIEGGAGDFPRLGQTWSRPSIS